MTTWEMSKTLLDEQSRLERALLKDARNAARIINDIMEPLVRNLDNGCWSSSLDAFQKIAVTATDAIHKLEKNEGRLDGAFDAYTMAEAVRYDEHMETRKREGKV